MCPRCNLSWLTLRKVQNLTNLNQYTNCSRLKKSNLYEHYYNNTIPCFKCLKGYLYVYYYNNTIPCFNCLESHPQRISQHNHQRMRFSLRSGCVAKSAGAGIENDLQQARPRIPLHPVADGFAFLTLADIQPAFDRLSARAASPELQQLVGYIDSNWIGSPVWQPRNWSIFQTNVRTNNDVEGKLLIST